VVSFAALLAACGSGAASSGDVTGQGSSSGVGDATASNDGADLDLVDAAT
jgi:hypothetical protein